jgi:hypothetical protein
MYLPDWLAKTKRVLSRRSFSSSARTESGSMLARRKVLFPSLALGKDRMLWAARLESPMTTKTTSSKPAGSMLATRATTWASNGPNCPGKSSQPRLLFTDCHWYCSTGHRKVSLAHSRASALLAKRLLNSRRQALFRRPGNIAWVGSVKLSPENPASRYSTLVVSTIFLSSSQIVNNRGLETRRPARAGREEPHATRNFLKVAVR